MSWTTFTVTLECPNNVPDADGSGFVTGCADEFEAEVGYVYSPGSGPSYHSQGEPSETEIELGSKDHPFPMTCPSCGYVFTVTDSLRFAAKALEQVEDSIANRDEYDGPDADDYADRYND